MKHLSRFSMRVSRQWAGSGGTFPAVPQPFGILVYPDGTGMRQCIQGTRRPPLHLHPTTVGLCPYIAGLALAALFVRAERLTADPRALLFCLIQPSARKGYSANFVLTEFCEVRHPLATSSNNKDHSFEGGANTNTLVRVALANLWAQRVPLFGKGANDNA